MKRGALSVDDKREAWTIGEPMSPPETWRPEAKALDERRCSPALRASETRYRRLFEAAKDGIAILNAETGQIDDANPFLLDLLGYTLSEVQQKTIWELGPISDSGKAHAAFAKLKADRYVRYEDLPLQTKDGRRIAVEFVSNLYPVDAGMVIQCNIRSIAARKKAEAVWRQAAAVNQAATEAEERCRVTRQIHDTVIQGLSLANIKLGSVARSIGLAELQEAQTELAAVRKLLLESISQCRLVMSDLTPPMLYELGLAPALAELIGVLHERHGATITLVDDGKTRLASHALLGLLFDAARELIVNAVKHAGPCRIQCSLQQADGHVRLTVTDNGAGFDAAQRVSLAEIATGQFGLFNTRERIEGMGGQLEICSLPGHGTDATITLPSEAGQPERA